MSPPVDPRDSPTYVKPGVERDILVRIQKPVRADMDYVRKVVSRSLPESERPSLGVFIAFAASVGADALALEFKVGPKVDLDSDLGAELRKRNRRPIKRELMDHYRSVYRGLPPAKFGEFIVFAAAKGSEIIRERYA